MPLASDKKIIQVADITLTNPSPNFSGTYNGNGFAILKSGMASSDFVFSGLEGAKIANVHVRDGFMLANESNNSKISHCSAVDKVLVRDGNTNIYTLCSSDQEKLADSGTNTFTACWYNRAAPGTDLGSTGYVWNESSQTMQQVSAHYLFNEDDTINWDYKYVKPE